MAPLMMTDEPMPSVVNNNSFGMCNYKFCLSRVIYKTYTDRFFFVLLVTHTRSQGVNADLDGHHQHYTKNVPVNESILSLLLKLHDKLTGVSNSYVPSECRLEKCKNSEDSRIGNGAFFVAKVLDKSCLLSDINLSFVKQLYESNMSWSDGGLSTDSPSCSSEER